jgi:hypothetical protein
VKINIGDYVKIIDPVTRVYYDIPADTSLKVVFVQEENVYVIGEDDDGFEYETDEIDYTETYYTVMVHGEEVVLYYTRVAKVDTRPKEQQIVEKIKSLWERQEYVKHRAVRL